MIPVNHSKLNSFGPGALVAAAFIGPGTVTVCILAGVEFGYSLLWVILVAMLACYCLQEMAARLGIVTRLGLSEVIRQEIDHKAQRSIALVLVFSAIVVGNAAYEAGNISGGALGVEGLFSDLPIPVAGLPLNPYPLLVSLLAFFLLYTGSYRLLEKTLMAMVLLMSLAFVSVALATNPSLSAILSGFVPRFELDQNLTIIALLGTTIVPYNLFLHAKAVQTKWQGPAALKTMRLDAAVAILFGGLISMAIIICAAFLQGAEIRSATELSESLEPLFGSFSRYVLSLGLFAAGITSAITAPLAATYVAIGCFGWKPDLKSPKSRTVWMSIILIGTVFSVSGLNPIEIIRFAQVANGILLPLIAVFVVWAVNRRQLMGNYINTAWQNWFGYLVIVMVTILAARSLWRVFYT